jgi:uncharacterized protein RhaS with RHS repeats
MGKRDGSELRSSEGAPSPNHAPETYTYDGVGGRVSKRRTTSSSGPIFEQTFAYDARGNVTTLGYPNCLAVCRNLTQVPTVTNTYTNGFLSTVSGNALGVVTGPHGR